MNTVIAQQNDTIDAICYRYYGYTARAVEAVYDANPGLCELSTMLPIGTPVKMPVINEKRTAATIQLWE